jgi:hypothetical protein
MHLHHRNDEPDALKERLGEAGAHALDCLGALLPSLMCNLSRHQHLLDPWQAYHSPIQRARMGGEASR